MENINSIIDIATGLIDMIVKLITDVTNMKDEGRAELLQRLVAAEAALTQTRASTKKSIAEETKATEEAIGAVEKKPE